MMSYLGDVVSRSPREKPIFNPEQIAGFEHMYEENGADNNYPYYLMRMTDKDGMALPNQAAGYMPGASVPDAAVALIGETRQAVADVADPGLPQEFLDSDLSGTALTQLTTRLDQQSLVYQQNLKHAKRWDAEIYASMASIVYDAPRKVTVTLPDGSRNTVEIMQYVMDEESGEVVALNDITNMEFDVYADIGKTYSSKKEQTREELGSLAAAVKESDPALHKALLLKQMLLMDGVDLTDVKEYSRKQLILAGFTEPESEEEIAMMEQASQQQGQPDAATLLAQAEMMKGQAQMQETQRKAQKDVMDAQNDQAKVQVDAYRAQTDRMDTAIDGQKVGADITYLRSKTQGQNLDNVAKLTQPFRARASA